MIRLTPREMDVLEHALFGLDNKEIGAELGIKKETVKGHIRSILRKKGVRTRLRLVAGELRKLIPKPDYSNNLPIGFRRE